MPVPEDGIPDWDRAKLTTGFQACDPHALIAFYSHFRPILVERARLFGILDGEETDAVETFLGDMLLKLCSAPELPRSLHAYVFVSFKRYAFRVGKAKRLETDTLLEFADAFTASARAVAEQSPHYDVTASAIDSGGAEKSGNNLALSRFASALLRGLSPEDKLILGARAEEMPLREVASLLGMNYNAANTRLCRLRSRLKMSASGVAARMDAKDRPIVERFLRRAREGANGNTHRQDSLSARTGQGGA